ncbi:MAG: TonB-dependent receptor [Deltaproteobacteria bacterium]|nr:TonB-dependent receptor [Deltaproteobacteria bacterium]
MVSSLRGLGLFALLLAGSAYARDGGVDVRDATAGEQSPIDGGLLGVDGGPDLVSGGPDLVDGGPDTEHAVAPPPVAQAASAPTQASDVVVTASRPLSRDRSQSSTVIVGERMRQSTRTTLFEVLSQEAADVYVPGRGVGLHGVASGATGGIKIRGLGGSPNSQILVVEDGVPDYQGIFGHPIPDAYVPSLVEDALIVKGGDSTLYGSNAMGGVVVIRSRWPDQDGYEVENDAGYGSYSTLRESVSFLGRANAWDVAGAFTDMTTQGHRAGAGGSGMVGSAALRYRWTPSLCLALRNKVVHVQGGDPGPVSTPTPDHWFDVWRDTVSAQLNYRRDKLRLSATPYLNLGVHRLYDGFYSHDYVGGAIGELDLRLHRAASVLVGLAVQGIDGRVEDRAAGERSDVSALGDVAFYGQATLRPLPTLNVVLGSRALASSEYGFVPLYKAGARWDAGRGFFVHGRVARNFRQPTIRERYLPYPVANPDLKPEYATNTDAGVGYLSAHLEIAATVYRNDARDLIKYFGAWPAAEVVNIDHIAIRGVEGRVRLRRLGPVSAMVSAAWQEVGRYTRQNPDAKIDFMVEGAHEFGPHFLAANLTGEWVHGLYMADYERQGIPDVFVMDLAARYRYRKGASGQRLHALEPYILLRNFLDRRYAYVSGYTMPGFNVFVGLKLGI